MTVDLTNLKVGDTVGFHCGGVYVLQEQRDFKFILGGRGGDTALVYIRGTPYNMDGTVYDWHAGGPPHPFDIVAVTPKPEPKRIKGWLNVYSNATDDSCLVVFRDSREEADETNKFFDKDRRIACIYIDVAEGEGL